MERLGVVSPEPDYNLAWPIFNSLTSYQIFKKSFGINLKTKPKQFSNQRARCVVRQHLKHMAELSPHLPITRLPDVSTNGFEKCLES